MQYRRFEDLPVWQAAAELAEKVYEFTEAEPLQTSLRPARPARACRPVGFQ